MTLELQPDRPEFGPFVLNWLAEFRRCDNNGWPEAPPYAAVAVELIEGGGIDIAIKGNISTPVINRRMLPLAVRRTVSLATVLGAALIAGGRPMVMTDAGVTTNCSLERMADLVTNSAEVARTVLGIRRPRVAILSANEKQIASLPSTQIGAELSKMDWDDAVVGHGLEERSGVDGSLVLTFCCSEDEKDVMVRKVKRLSKVIALEEHPYESERLRKSVIILATRRLTPRDVAGDVTFLTSELVDTDPHGWTYLPAGSPSELDPILVKLETDGAVKTSYTRS